LSTFKGRLACVIGADGSIARGYKIVSCERRGENEYILTWEEPLQGEAKTNFSAVVGSTMYEDVEPGLCTVGLMEDAYAMRVCTYDVHGAAAARPFHLAVFRD
jgi:hypothetical protein